MSNTAKVFQLAGIDTDPIKRLEEDGTVRYTNIKLLSPGSWTDAGSKETVWYSPEGIRNLEMREDNVVNIMHDVDNEVASVGSVDPESVETDEQGNLYGDVVLHMDNAASEFADENMKTTLESGGSKGFGGPSVEIDAEGQKVEWNDEKGMHELKAGYLSGTGFVSNPASKPVAFSRQTAERGVALADGSQESKTLYRKDDTMSEELDLEALREKYNLGEDIDEETVAELAEAGALDLEEDEDEEEEEAPETPEDDEEEEETEMEDGEIEQMVSSLADRVETLEEQLDAAMAAEDVEEALSEELEEVKSNLADAETVDELEADVDKRLSELENEPKETKTLADGSDTEDNGAWDNADSGVSYDPRTGSLSR